MKKRHTKCSPNLADANLQYVWKRPRATPIEPVRAFNLECSQPLPLQLETNVVLFENFSFSCQRFAQALPGLFDELRASINGLKNLEQNGLPFKKKPDLVVAECVEFIIFLLEWVKRITPSLPPSDSDSVLNVIFEKALSCSKWLSHIDCENVGSGGEVEANKSSTFIMLIFRTYFMHLHLSLCRADKTPSVFDKTVRETFAKESLLTALQLAVADKRWFQSPILWPSEEDVGDRPVQPALAWLHSFLSWAQMQKGDNSVWVQFQGAFQDFCKRKDAPNSAKAEMAWDFLTTTLAPMYRIMITDFPDIKKCEFCRQLPTTCGQWSLVNELLEMAGLDFNAKIARIEMMLKLWCPDRKFNNLIEPLFGAQLNEEVNVSAFLGEGVYVIPVDGSVSLAPSSNKFLAALGLLRDYVRLMDKVGSSRFISSFYTMVECKVTKTATEAQLRSLVKTFALFLSMGTRQERLERLRGALQGLCDLSDADFAECGGQTQAVVVHAFHIFGAICQDHKQDIEGVVTMFRKWIKIEGMSAQVLIALESLLNRSTNDRDQSYILPALGDFLKDDKLLDKASDMRRRALEMLSRLLSRAEGANEVMSSQLYDLAMHLKTRFQTSVKSGSSDVMFLGSIVARLIHFRQTKTGVDVQEFEFKPATAMWGPQPKKVLYVYWAHVLSPSSSIQEQKGNLENLLKLAPSSSLASSLALPQLLLEMFMTEPTSKISFPLFLSSFASLIDCAKTAPMKSGRAVSLPDAKYLLISDMCFFLFRTFDTTVWVNRVAEALGSSGEAMGRLRELIINKVVCPLFAQCQSYQPLVVALLQVIAKVYAEVRPSQELQQLPSALAHLLTTAPQRSWEWVGLTSLRFHVYNLVEHVKYKWPPAFCNLLQESVLSEQAGKDRPKVTNALPERVPVPLEVKTFYGKLITPTSVDSVNAEELLRKGSRALKLAIGDSFPS